MNNSMLENGAVLPHALLGENAAAMMEGFNKSYCNFPLRVGVVTASYPVNHEINKSKLTTEYDVLVIEQNADKGATTIQYRNCLSAEGMGSIADYFEKALRPKKKKTTKGDSVNLKGQNGAIVLLLCLDGMSDKGIIVTCLTHPDRPTNLTDEGPRLIGEYNGVHVFINNDGSCSLTFKGATDNDGNILDSNQGNTEMRIEKDGSYQVQHRNTTLRLDRNGVSTLHTKSNVVVTSDEGDIKVTATQGKVQVVCKNNVEVTTTDGDAKVLVAKGSARVTVKQDATVECEGTATVEGKIVKLGAGAVEAALKGDTLVKIFDNHTHIGNLGFETTQPNQQMEPALSKKVKVE